MGDNESEPEEMDEERKENAVRDRLAYGLKGKQELPFEMKSK